MTDSERRIEGQMNHHLPEYVFRKEKKQMGEVRVLDISNFGSYMPKDIVVYQSVRKCSSKWKTTGGRE